MNFEIEKKLEKIEKDIRKYETIIKEIDFQIEKLKKRKTNAQEKCEILHKAESYLEELYVTRDKTKRINLLNRVNYVFGLKNRKTGICTQMRGLFN